MFIRHFKNSNSDFANYFSENIDIAVVNWQDTKSYAMSCTAIFSDLRKISLKINSKFHEKIKRETNKHFFYD